MTPMTFYCPRCGKALQTGPRGFSCAACEALKTAIGHIEHMAAWITNQNAGYSFESLGEDMPGIRAALVPAASADIKARLD